MTNTATVIPHGLSFLLQEAEEMEKYTRVPVARETDREDFESVFVCVWRRAPPQSQQVMERGREKKKINDQRTWRARLWNGFNCTPQAE